VCFCYFRLCFECFYHERKIVIKNLIVHKVILVYKKFYLIMFSYFFFLKNFFTHQRIDVSIKQLVVIKKKCRFKEILNFKF